jgi:Flp pilus assembly protein TadB
MGRPLTFKVMSLEKNLIAKYCGNKLLSVKTPVLLINGVAHQFDQNKNIHLYLNPGQYWVEAKSGRLSSERVSVLVNEVEIRQLRIKQRLSFSFILFSNLIVLLFLYIAYSNPVLLRLFWLLLALNSLIPVYFLYLRRKRFFFIKQLP